MSGAAEFARDRMEPAALRDELEHDRDRAVVLRPGRREEAVRDLPLHHHTPELDRRQRREALHHDRRGPVVRQVGDELRRRGSEVRAEEVERVAEDQLDVPAPASRSRETPERAVG
jgi:hypothetical protein